MATNVDRFLYRGPFRAPSPVQVDPEQAAWSRAIETAVSTKALNQAQKNAVWRHIKAHHPDLVGFLNDPTVQALISAGATPAFPQALIRAAKEAAQQVTS